MATIQDILGGGIPAGLLTPEQEAAAQQRAQNAGLLNLAFGLLQASQGQPGQGRPSLGQIIGQAGPVGVAGYQQSFENTLQSALRGMQIGELKRKQAEEDRLRKAREQFESRIAGATTMQPTRQGVLDTQTNQVTDQAAADRAVMDYLRVASPIEYAKLVAKEPRALPASIQEYQYAVSQGFKGTFEDFKKSLTESGAQKIELKMGGGVASQIGPILKENQVAATGAALQVDAADRIISAVDTGKVMSGPGTTPVFRAAQIGRVLGVTGKDTNEIIANTRTAIRGLAEMTLQGRKSMRGEGQITEQEGKLAERAFSGDIADLTNDEIKILANASKRAAQFTLNEYNKKLDILEKNPETAPLIPFFRVNVMPSMSGQAPVPSGVTVRKKPQ